MASKRCPKCKARNKVDAKKCVKCNHSFDVLAPSFVQGTAWSAADQYEESIDGSKGSKGGEVESFWRIILILGIILTATVLMIGFGIPLLACGIYGGVKKITESKLAVKVGIVAGSIVFGSIIYQFVVAPLFKMNF